MLYLALEAHCDGEITAGYLGAHSQQANQVRLGIVITHFNRKEYVLPAIKRIREELLHDPAYAGKVSLIVVDNCI